MPIVIMSVLLRDINYCSLFFGITPIVSFLECAIWKKILLTLLFMLIFITIYLIVYLLLILLILSQLTRC